MSAIRNAINGQPVQKCILAALPVAFLLALAPIALAGENRSSSIDQIGNVLHLRQAGIGNTTRVRQSAIATRHFGLDGDTNAAASRQQGTRNQALILQYGTSLKAEIKQSGHLNASAINQFGLELRARIEQRGNRLGVTVNQYGIGSGRGIQVRQY